jgi:hypothetical protein
MSAGAREPLIATATRGGMVVTSSSTPTGMAGAAGAQIAAKGQPDDGSGAGAEAFSAGTLP